MDTQNLRLLLTLDGRSVQIGPCREADRPNTWMVDAKYGQVVEALVLNKTDEPIEVVFAMHGIDMLAAQLIDRPVSLPVRGWIVPSQHVLVSSSVLSQLFVGHYSSEFQERLEAAHITGDSLRHGLQIQAFKPYTPGVFDLLQGRMAATTVVGEISVASGIWPRQGRKLEALEIMFVEVMH